MFIKRLQVKGLLSFGPDGIDLPLEPLNVIIGPNGSGKSNLLKVLALLQAAPTNLSSYAMKNGDAADWFWMPHGLGPSAIIVADIASPFPMQHSIELMPILDQFSVWAEQVCDVSTSHHSVVAKIDSSGNVFTDCSDSRVGTINLPTGQSMLSFEFNDWPKTNDYGLTLTLRRLGWKYDRMKLHRDWTFGDDTPSRLEQSAEVSSETLTKRGNNLSNVLSTFSASNRDKLTRYLGRFYDGIVGFSTPVNAGKVSLVLEESGGRQIPAARLSDGTLRYLSLLAILLDPVPPPLIGIEEPELGLHPDVVYDLAELLVEASTRTQLVVTTHSPTLIDALTDYPSSVVVCEKYQGQTRFKRVNPEALEAWQDEPGLADVWSAGGIGGNRW